MGKHNNNLCGETKSKTYTSKKKKTINPN